MIAQRNRLAAVITAAVLALPGTAAFAQDAAPPPPDAPALPSYSQPNYGNTEDVVRGRILSIDGAYNLKIRDDKGYVDNIELHQGTIINPTGLRLAPGMSVTIRGINRGNALDANQIDTPYNVVTPVYAYPYPAYPAYGYGAYGYPYLGYGYPYGPSVSIGIGIVPGWGYGYRGGYWGGGHYGGRWH